MIFHKSYSYNVRTVDCYTTYRDLVSLIFSIGQAFDVLDSSYTYEKILTKRSTKGA
jgi:hypothetical protein